MKNTIRRNLIGAILFSLMAGIVVLIIGLTLGWKTSRQFSDGFFWAGALMIFIGLISCKSRASEPLMGHRSSWVRRNAAITGRQTLLVAKTSWPYSGYFRPAAVRRVLPGRETILVRNGI